MSYLHKKLAAVFLAIAALVPSLFGAGQIAVRVLEDSSEAALEGATVSIPDLGIRRATDRSGRLTLKDVPAGEYNVVVSYRGLPDSEAFVEVTDDQVVGLPVRMGVQPESTDGDIYELEDFVVSGGVTSDDIAQQLKRNSLNIKDVVASDTMGQMPDRTVADAVRRLPGVSVERAAGQPQNEYVTIRGMYSDFNKVSVDGMAITISNSDGASRSVPLNVISSSSADAIEVTKAVTPDMDADSIGGTINIRTKNAFDYGGRNLSGEFGVSYSDIADDFSSDLPYDKWNPSMSVSYSDFLDEEGTVGINIGANYSKELYATSEVTGNNWGLLTEDDLVFPDDLPDQVFYYPESINLQEVFEEVERFGITTGIEWRPDESSSYSANYSFSRTETTFERQRLSFFNSEFFIPPSNNDGQNYTDYLYDGFVDKNASYYEDTQDVHVLSMNAEKEFDEWTLYGGLGFNYSVFEEDPGESFRGTLTQFGPVFDFEYDSTGNSYTPSVTRPGFDPDDIDSYDALLSGADSLSKEITDTEFAISGDAERSIEIAGLPIDMKFGGKTRIRTREFDEEGESYIEPDNGEVIDIFGDPRVADLVADYRVKSRVDGDYPGGFYLDPQDFKEYVEILEEEGLVINDPRDELFNLNNTYEVDENIYAAYLQGSTELGKFTILTGVRFEYTDIEFRGNDVFIPDFEDFDPSVDYVDKRKETNDYLDVLPGLFIRYDQSEDIIWRASINKTLQRASYRQLNPAERRRPSNDAGIRDTVRRGDIDLDPTESWNLDLGFDYYYSASGFVSVGVFGKYMENNIYEVTQLVATGNPGEFDEVTETFNADYATVYGVEFLIDQQFTALPSYLSNFGASFNATLTESEVETDLEDREDSKTDLFGQVDASVNAALYYRGEKFRARLSYNWTDDYLLVGGLDPTDENLDEYADDYGTFDFTMGYYILDNLEIFFEAENITNEANRGYVGNDSRLLYNSYTGTTYFIGASWNL